MSRRSVPRIASADLRDHADEARVERIWARLDADLPAVAPAASRRPAFAYLAIAAAFAAFAGGVVVGKTALPGPVLAAIAPVQSNERATVDVLAAGSEGRSFSLPGGGQLMLQPGATVEVERAGGELTLKLLQGAASVDTIGAQRVAGLTIIAGDAQLNTQAGSVLNVRRNQDDMDVSVSDGAVSITSPAGTQRLGRGGQAEAVPIHALVSALSPTASPAQHAPRAARVAAAGLPRVSKTLPVAGPGWLSRYDANDFAGALAQLRQEPGGIAGAVSGARSANELMAISTLARAKDGDPGAAMTALRTVVDRFPEDANAQVAAYSLAGMLQTAGKGEQARDYLDRAKKLNGPFAEDALCRRIKGERAAGNKEEAIRQAREYVAKYPDGRCKDEVELALEDDGAGGALPAPVAPAAPGSSGAAPVGSAAP
jgi:ferric-dicitrate binding protein FerR (iron transport regulator)